MSSDRATAGTVLRIERSSIHDGQGLRTVLFLKGCSLNCSWCSTPESKNAEPEKGYAAENCTNCGKCVDACPEGALHSAESNSQVITDPLKCKLCFLCAEICPGKAVKKYGFAISVKEVMREIAKDEIFYFHSGGGITLSGGEPLNQAVFASEIMRESKKLGIHTAVESSLFGSYERLEMLLPWLDVLYADLKHMDSQTHRDWIGEDNYLILDNLLKADQSHYPFSIIIRVPLIPGFNDSDQNLQDTMEFCAGLKKIKAIELLPYHRLGSDTYRHLGRDNPCSTLTPQTTGQLLDRVSFMKHLNSDIKVNIGSGFNEG